MDIDIVPFQARLEVLAYNNHMQIVNFANIEKIENKEFQQYTRAMVIGQSFSNDLMKRFNQNIFNFHIKLIKEHIANIAYQIFHLLSIEGYNALILPPLFLLDNDIYSDTNKIIAKLAGVGNIGKNNFFVSPTYGVKIILSSILTNAPLEYDSKFKIDLCQKCNICNSNDFIESILKCPYGKDKKYLGG
jgi:epoxyqueuosine reductase QueG